MYFGCDFEKNSLWGVWAWDQHSSLISFLKHGTHKCGNHHENAIFHSFLKSLLASHGPNYLEKLFGPKVRFSYHICVSRRWCPPICLPKMHKQSLVVILLLEKLGKEGLTLISNLTLSRIALYSSNVYLGKEALTLISNFTLFCIALYIRLGITCMTLEALTRWPLLSQVWFEGTMMIWGGRVLK